MLQTQAFFSNIISCHAEKNVMVITGDYGKSDSFFFTRWLPKLAHQLTIKIMIIVHISIC